MNDDMDRRLRESGQRWRDAHPVPMHTEPQAFARPPRSRWVAPLAAAAAVVAVIGGIALLRDDGDRVSGEPTDRGSADALAGVVPWVYADPRQPHWPAVDDVWSPDVAYAGNETVCTAEQVLVEAQPDGATGTRLLVFRFVGRADTTCAVPTELTVRFFDGDQEMSVPRFEPEHRAAGQWPGSRVLLDAGEHAGVLTVSWSPNWCQDPVQVDRAVIAWEDQEVSVDAEFGSPRCDDPGSSDASFVEVGPLLPEGAHQEPGPQFLEPLVARQVGFVQGRTGGPSTFVVELLATDHDLSLAICPDAELRHVFSADDQDEMRYGLNCDGVPYRDDADLPYLPQGQPVRFAVEVDLSGPDDGWSWTLLAPRPVEVPLVVPGSSATESAAPGTQLPTPIETPTSGPVAIVSEEQATFFLDLSNQSFIDDPVVIHVAIDGVPIIEEEFFVGGQHTWKTFPIRLEPGPHHVVVSTFGDKIVEDIVVPRDRPLYALSQWWHYRDERARFDWQMQDTPFFYG